MGRVTIIDEKHMTRPTISKKAMNRIVENKDHQYKEMRSHYEEKLHYKVNEVAMHVHNEKQLSRVITEKERLIYVVGGLSFFAGGLVGFVCG